MENEMPPETVAETKRLILKHFCESDINRLAEILADPEVMKFSIKGTYSLGQTREFVEHTISSYKSNGLGLWAAVHKADDNLIGYCGHLVHEIDGQREIELTYRFDKEYWGKGLATEAGKATCKYAFKQLGLNRLISIIIAENIASIRVAEKCGLRYEKDSSFQGVPVRIYAIDGIVRIFPAQTDKDLAVVKQLFTVYADYIFEVFSLHSVSLAERLSQKILDEADNLPGEYAAPKGCILLAEYKDEITGCIAISEIASGLCELKRIYVKPHFRRRGIGKKLADAVIAKAVQLKFKRMRLAANELLPGAKKLYSLLGFKEIGHIEGSPLKNSVYMELKLK